MKRVLKYKVVNPDGDQPFTIQMPRGARILSAGAQNSGVVVWALVDHVQANQEDRELRVIATGEPIEEGRLDGFDFVSTVQMQLAGLELVWHVWAKPSDWGPA